MLWTLFIGSLGEYNFICIYCFTDTDECASQPCSNGGTCQDRVNGYVCSCMPGYTGTTCVISKCGLDTDEKEKKRLVLSPWLYTMSIIQLKIQDMWKYFILYIFSMYLHIKDKFSKCVPFI